NGPMDVSWLYAQTDGKLSDLKKLEDEGLVLLGETESWRDTVARRDFVPTIAPPLTPEQQAVWEVIEARLKQWNWEANTNLLHPSPAPLPESREGKESSGVVPPPNSGEVIPEGERRGYQE